MMRDPFDNNRKGHGWNRLLDIDSWIDSSMYNLYAGAGELWESVTIFFRRFRVSGLSKFIVEIADEGVSLALVGSILMLALALPAFEETEKNWRDQADFSVVFLDRYGKEIGERGIRQDSSAEIDALPDHFIKAVLATEDRRFFDHYGIDFVGLVRAMAENVRANSVVQGGSTITQQLAKNLFLTNDRTIERKIKEAFLSLWLEVNLTKKEILKLYLDRAYMGGGNFGVGAAAQYYFGKDIKDVTLAEASLLAGLYKAPTRYAPHVNLPAARARANEVLTNMVQAGFMTEGQVIGSRRQPATIIEREGDEGPNYFLDFAFEEVKRLAARFPTRTLVAKTTVDLDLQRAAEDAIETHLKLHGEAYGVRQAALVAAEHDGSIRALVGGRDYGLSQFNRATQARRQPGSSFKPYVYTAAIEHFGYDENTRVTDGPVCIGRGKPWCPRNYSGGYAGRVDFTRALVKSYNTIPAKLYIGRDGLERLGGERVEQMARTMGITSPLIVNAPMVLGSNGLTVLEMARGYGTFMAGGMALDAHAIVQITDIHGNALYDYKTDREPPRRAISERTASSMNKMLVQIPEWGTGRRAALEGVRAAGKTGTTQAYRDAWFVGFTGNYVAAVWFGNDNYQPTRRLTGGRLPAMTWQKFMTYAHQNIELRAIPFVDPLPGGEQQQRLVAQPAPAEDGQQPAVRPKVLSVQAERALRELETIFKAAKPIRLNQQLAARRTGGDEAGEPAGVSRQ